MSISAGLSQINTLLKDKNATILCPVCHIGFLKVSDNYFFKLEPSRFERTMGCNRGGAEATSLHATEVLRPSF